MKVEKEVTIYVESFIDALEIIDKMDITLPHAVIFMDVDEFYEGKCHVIINKTMFLFLPIHQLFKENKKDKRGYYVNYLKNFYNKKEKGEEEGEKEDNDI